MIAPAATDCKRLIGGTAGRRDSVAVSYYNLPIDMGARRCDRQANMWIATTDFPTAVSHPFSESATACHASLYVKSRC
jgi:hypothetical protein